MGATALALSSFEVAVGRRGAALPGRQLVGIHPQAHRTAGEPPFRTGSGKDLAEPLFLGLGPYPHGTRHDQHPNPVGHPAAAQDLGHGARSSIRPLVQEPTKTVSTGMSRIGVPGRRSIYANAFSAACRSASRFHEFGSGTDSEAGRPDRVGAPGDERTQRGRVDVDLGVELSTIIGAQPVPVGDRCVPLLAGRGMGAAAQELGRSSRRVPPFRPVRRPRCSCCRSSSGLPSTAIQWRCRGIR